ncbi:hypothetical protein [Desulfofundulus sp. TPOSR]|nr:hypothetical protein [Desulfofundulus sp. TPOSR]
MDAELAKMEENALYYQELFFVHIEAVGSPDTSASPEAVPSGCT